MNKQFCTTEEYEWSKKFMEVLPQMLEEIEHRKARHIYKYVLPQSGIQASFVLDTANAKIIKPLDIQYQDDRAVLWAEVELTDIPHNYLCWSLWTGEAIPENRKLIYITTLQDPMTGLVYHYYIELED